MTGLGSMGSESSVERGPLENTGFRSRGRIGGVTPAADEREFDGSREGRLLRSSMLWLVALGEPARSSQFLSGANGRELNLTISMESGANRGAGDCAEAVPAQASAAETRN